MSSQATLVSAPERSRHHPLVPVLPSFFQESRQTFVLALPLIAGQVGQMLMGVADTVMIGRVGVTELGAAAFANSIIAIPFVLAIGLLSSVSVRVSNARGADAPKDAQDAVRHGTWLALASSAAVFALFCAAVPFLHLFGQSADVTERTAGYLIIVAASLIPALLSMTWKNHADALNHPWPAFWILLGGVLLNVGLNWLWIGGHWGFPAWGLEGAAMATLVSRIATATAMFLWMTRSPRTRNWCPPRWLAACTGEAFKRLLKIGGPASLQLLTEVAAFSAVSLLIGTISKTALAAHQVALTCAATTFMVPLGMAMAITVRIGELAGAGAENRMHRVLLGGWMYATGFMCVSALVFLIGGKWIAHQFVSDQAVIATAAELLVIAGIFQLVDGLQVVSAGALRGVGDVRLPAWLALLAYWGIALPLGALLMRDWGAAGLWTGLAAGLFLAAVSLGLRGWRLLGSHRHAIAK